MTPAPERIPLPVVAAAPAPRGVPIVATVAPLVLAVALWIMTSSAYALLFALLGPVVAVASVFDARRTARRTRRRELATARERLEVLEAELAPRLAARARALASQASPPAELTLDPDIHAWYLGHGQVPSGIELLGTDEPPELSGEIARLREVAGYLRDAPVVVDAVEAITVSGAEPLARSFSRALVLQAVARCAPGAVRVVVPEGESWTRQLPARCVAGDRWEVVHEDRRVLVIGPDIAGRTLELSVGDAGEEPRMADVSGWRPCFLAAVEAEQLACRLAELATQRGWRPPGAIPGEVDLEQLLDETDATAAAAAIGRDASGTVLVDLEQHGPHALVAGTTGAGKSELLVSWVLALAARRPPAELAFLLVDFKGGSSFMPLLALPHVAGVVSDLDEATATRAVESLRAELRRREAVLADPGVRDIDELPPRGLPRLVIVVDEFAALVALDAELQGVFADLAARGRSLGMHLILGTQRPAGVVRDAVLANITVRICLRVLETAESSAVVGVPDAAALPLERRGRGLLRDAGHAREVQFARAEPGFAARIAERWRGHPVPEARPWLDPLPARIAVREVPPAPSGLAVGFIDLPDHQRRDPLIVDPWQAGALLVVGAASSGRTEALATISAAAMAGSEVRWVASEPAELWAALCAAPRGERALVVVDDLDLLLARSGPEERADLAELLDRVAREGRRSGIAVVASARGGGALQTAAAAFEQRMLLRLPTREDHLLNGGETRDFRADRRPGAAIWRGREAQLALSPAHPAPWHAVVAEVRLAVGEWAVVTPHPERWLGRLADAGIAAAAVEASRPGAAVVVGDVDAWLMEHTALARVRRSGRLLLAGCSRSDLRALARSRGAVPPLGRGPRDRDDAEAWLVEGTEVRRVRVRVEADGVEAAQASPSGASSNSRP
ncbi:MAG: FtsK/SpoIIIE domain-containing protein [Protaetiibacter sp.]